MHLIMDKWVETGDIDVAMNIIDQVGPDLYYDMIGGPQNAAWALDDEVKHA